MFTFKNSTQVELWCRNCDRNVSVSLELVRLLRCVEDGWLSCTYTCSTCNQFMTDSPSEELVQKLSALGVPIESWSVSDNPCPIVRQPQPLYKRPERKPSWLPIDEVDVARAVDAMNTVDWLDDLNSGGR